MYLLLRKITISNSFKPLIIAPCSQLYCKVFIYTSYNYQCLMFAQSSNCGGKFQLIFLLVGKVWLVLTLRTWLRYELVKHFQEVNRLFSSSCGRNFAPTIPLPPSIYLRGVGREVTTEDWGKKMLCTSAFSSSVPTSLPELFIGGYTSFDLPFLVNMLLETFMLFFASLAKFRFSFTFLTPSLHNCTSPLYSSEVICPCFHSLHISFFPFSVTSNSLLGHSSLLSFSPDFLFLGISNSCAFWKTFLKICKSVPLLCPICSFS